MVYDPRWSGHTPWSCNFIVGPLPPHIRPYAPIKPRIRVKADSRPIVSRETAHDETQAALTATGDTQ